MNKTYQKYSISCCIYPPKQTQDIYKVHSFHWEASISIKNSIYEGLPGFHFTGFQASCRLSSLWRTFMRYFIHRMPSDGHLFREDQFNELKLSKMSSILLKDSPYLYKAFYLRGYSVHKNCKIFVFPLKLHRSFSAVRCKSVYFLYNQ